MTIWIITIPILVLSETVLSNLHTLQLTQSNQVNTARIRKAVVPDYQSLQVRETRHNQCSITWVIHAIVNCNMSSIGIERQQFTHTTNSCIWVMLW